RDLAAVAGAIGDRLRPGQRADIAGGPRGHRGAAGAVEHGGLAGQAAGSEIRGVPQARAQHAHSELLRAGGGSGDVDRQAVDARREHVHQRGGGAAVPGGGAPQQGAHGVQPLPEVHRVLRDPRHLPGPCLAPHRAPPCIRCSALDAAPRGAAPLSQAATVGATGGVRRRRACSPTRMQARASCALHLLAGRIRRRPRDPSPLVDAGWRAPGPRWTRRKKHARSDRAVGYRGAMKPLSTITVSSDLPEALAPLRDLALNLRWTWRRQTVDLFRALDARAFAASGENPIAMLPMVSAGRLAEAAHDEAFLARMRSEIQDLRTYLDSGRWFQRTVPGAQGGDGASIAYFSMEFGITPTLPIYSGGLGILAGDHLK